jgi:FKBP-type peptidyl-prolyl cis-trans isomerase
MKTLIYLSLGLSLFLFSCRDQMEKDIDLIEEYLEENNLTAEVTPEGVYYIIEQEGIGPNPTRTSTVVVHYEGFLLDGTKFDSSRDRGQSARFPLTSVILGWQYGIPVFKENGRGKLIIPSPLAYGSQARGALIPKNAVLIFDVELIDIE